MYNSVALCEHRCMICRCALTRFLGRFLSKLSIRRQFLAFSWEAFCLLDASLSKCSLSLIRSGLYLFGPIYSLYFDIRVRTYVYNICWRCWHNYSLLFSQQGTSSIFDVRVFVRGVCCHGDHVLGGFDSALLFPTLR